MPDTHSLRRSLFWFIESKGSVHGYLAQRHTHRVRRAWQWKGVHLRAAKSREKGEASPGLVSSQAPPPNIAH